MKVWISRNKNDRQEEDDCINIWITKPNKYEEENRIIYGTDILTLKTPKGSPLKWSVDKDGDDLLVVLVAVYFEESFGFLPEPGTCIEKELELT